METKLKGQGWLALFASVVAMLFTCGGLRAQAPTAGLVYHPGDTVRVVVSFKAPIALDGGTFYFQLTGELHNDQQGFARDFGGSGFKKLSDTEYEVSGEVSAALASGTWRLGILDMRTQGVTKRYTYPSDFTSEVTIRIENPKRVEFPAIKDVRVQP
jgi:hypothetical protein